MAGDAQRHALRRQELRLGERARVQEGDANRLAAEGKAIIMISSEMSELIGMSDSIMVMCDGRVTGFIDGKDATQENIMALATQFE